MAEHDDSIGGRARDGGAGWYGRARRFLAEVRNEMARVTWPSRREVYATTLVVIVRFPRAKMPPPAACEQDSDAESQPAKLALISESVMLVSKPTRSPPP